MGGTGTASPGSASATAARTLDIEWLGTVPYARAAALQRELVAARREGAIADRVLLLEHPHVITLGASAHADHVLLDAGERALLGIEIHDSGRGGDVTYHGPGQLVGYPILDLKPDRKDLHRYVRDLEEVLIHVVRDFGIRGERCAGRTGVWVGNHKIAAIGVRISSGWITSHGFALNVSTDLRFFESIVPCGIRDAGVTSISECTGSDPGLDAVRRSVAQHFATVFDRIVAPPSRRVPERLVRPEAALQ